MIFENELDRMMIQKFEAKPVQWSNEYYFSHGDKRYQVTFETTYGQTPGFASFEKTYVRGARIFEVDEHGDDRTHSQLDKFNINVEHGTVDQLASWIVKVLVHQDAAA